VTKGWAVLIVVATMVTTVGLTAVPSSATTRAATSYEPFLKSAITDIQSYWASEFPQVYGSPYKPIGQVIPAGPTTAVPECQGQKISYTKDVKGNAFYCFQSNFIVYDNQTLFPALAKHFGPFALALVLAHEWGHAIQDRAGIDRRSAPPVYIELQADCFAGSWAKHIADGQSKAIKFAAGDLDTALAAYLTFRDPVGNAPDDPQSHGDAFDRTSAFQTGFDGGAPACKPLLASPPPVTETQFTSAQDAATGGNLPAEQVIPVTMELLDE
jgi:predicted metalloprotease